MSDNVPQGLRGLKGIGSLSRTQYDSFINKNKELIAKHGYDPMYINNLYSNKQFIDKYGIDTFKAMPDINMRNDLYKTDVVQSVWDQKYKPTKNNKGLGMDYDKYNEMSIDSKLKALESGYLSPVEFENKWNKHLKEIDTRSKVLTNSGAAAFMPVGMNFLTPKAASDTGDAFANMLGNEGAEEYLRKKNQKILDDIYNDDADKMAGSSNVLKLESQAYLALQGLGDEEVRKSFIKSITKGSYKDKYGMSNLGIPEFEAHYGNGTDSQITSEMSNFSVDDMRKVLAKKEAYEASMSPGMAATALNNYAKRYIKEHQGTFKRGYLYGKDFTVSTLSYMADQVNGITELGRMAEDALFNEPTVMVDDAGNILDPNKTHVMKGSNGGLYYRGNDGKAHFIHQERVNRKTLHQMGKNADGSDIEGAFGIDFLTLNPVYWSRAEQYKTLDAQEQKHYESIGASPYSVAYNPNEEESLGWEVFKMTTFGAADTFKNLIPFGIGAAGNFLSNASKVGKIASRFGKAMETTGKLLSQEKKFGQIAQGTSGALGISYAYSRGAYQETLQKNLANAEEAVINASKQDIWNKYNTDKNYKAQVDKLINAEAAKMKADYISKMKREGGMQIADEEAFDRKLHTDAQKAVIATLWQNRVQERMASKEYGDLQEQAIRGAGDAAFNIFLTEGVKYGLVNTVGYRKHLYTNPASLTKKVDASIKGLKEITTSAGRKRLTTKASNFLTRKDKIKEFGKTLGSQFWGGAWTNGTDDMQVDAAERINEDSYNRYLQAYQNGEAIADTYSFADGIYSYIKGLDNSTGQESTARSALVGGLGGTMNITPHFTNIASLATKEGREAYKNNFWRRPERDADGMLVKDENGNVKYKELGKKNDWRGQLNFFVQNGVLNTYYGKKQSERTLQDHADYVNNLLDSYNDFEDIEKLIASRMSMENFGSLSGKDGEIDIRTMQFLNALHSMNTLNKLGDKSDDPTTKSSVVQKAKDLIKNAAQLNLEEGKNPFSDEEINNLLSQYYAANPGMVISAYDSQKALYDIAENAKRLQQASDALDKAEEEIQKLEKNRGEEIPSNIRTKMKEQLALDGHWSERLENMKEEIDDSSSDEKPTDTNVILATVGGLSNARRLVKVYERQKKDLEDELAEIRKKTEELKSKAEEANDVYQRAKVSPNTSIFNDEGLREAKNKSKDAQAALQSSQEQEKYQEELIAMTIDKLNNMQGSIDTVEKESKESPDSKERVLTADEIFSLDPVTRARMMNEGNRELYSKEQQREIEKLERRLQMKDSAALEKIQDISLLKQRLDANQDAYSRMAKNPEAAAWEVERQRIDAAKLAVGIIDQRNAEIVVSSIEKIIEDNKNQPNVTNEETEAFVFNTLKELSPTILDIMDSQEMLPQYSQQIKAAKEWGKTVEDISAIVHGRKDRDDKWKDNTLKNIDAIAQNANTREELVDNLEKVIDDVEDANVKSDMEYVLKGLENLGYQRNATILEDRKKRKEREEAAKAKQEEDKQKIEEEKRKTEEEAKATAEKKAKEVEETPGQPIDTSSVEPAGNLDDIDLEDTDDNSSEQTSPIPEPQTTTPKGKEDITDIKEDNKQKSSSNFIDYGDSVFSVTPEEYEDMPDTSKHEENATFEVHSMEKKDGNWYFNGNFAGSNKQTKVKASAKFDTSEADWQQQVNERKSQEVQDGVMDIDKELGHEEDAVYSSTPSLEKQAESVKNRGVVVSSSDTTEDSITQNALGQKAIDTKATTLSGNSMSRYESAPLEKYGVLKLKEGEKPDDKMSKYYAWMDAAGIKLQNIIDRELAPILKRNPHAKVKFMAVAPRENATHDDYMQTHLMLVLDYDDKINKGITAIHDNSNGGVIESNGKKYLIIGTAGYGNMNKDKLVLYNILWNSNIVGGLQLKTKRKEFFEKYPNERFYVNEELSTEVVPHSLIPGYLVKKRVEDESQSESRSILDILNDKDRNPRHLGLEEVVWGIQEMKTFLLSDERFKDQVMVPRNKYRNLGSAFVMVPASNGKYVPTYFKVLKYTEMKEGSLTKKIDDAIEKIMSTDKDTRNKGIAILQNIFYLSKEGDFILSRNTKAEVSLVHDGITVETFSPSKGNFDKNHFKDALERINPRVNITARVIVNLDLLKEYDEAGALRTDIAQFCTAGSSYSIYGLDTNGNMIKPETPSNPAPKTEDNSNFRKDTKQVIFNQEYYVEDNGVYSLNGKVITDEFIIKQLKYNQMVVENELFPVMTKGTKDYYILSNGEHPEVIYIDQNSKKVKEMPEEDAKEFVQKIREQEESEKREKKAEEALKVENAANTENVDLDDGSFQIDPQTGEQIPITPNDSQLKDNNQEEQKKRGKETKDVEKEIPITNTPIVAHTQEFKTGENKSSTQKFTKLVLNREYKIRIEKIIKKKWENAPKNNKDRMEFLRKKGINVDAIGTSKEAIEAWIYTLENCK